MVVRNIQIVIAVQHCQQVSNETGLKILREVLGLVVERVPSHEYG